MDNRGGAPLLGALLGVVAALTVLLAACGGEAGGGEDIIDLSAGLTEKDLQVIAGLGRSVVLWNEWRTDDLKYLERDFALCFEINEDVPPPAPGTVRDDGVGHTRARVGCTEAVSAIEKAAPGYRRVVEPLEGLPAADHPVLAKLQADFVAARRARLAWFEAVQPAWAARDMPTLKRLAAETEALVSAESKASLAFLSFRRPAGSGGD